MRQCHRGCRGDDGAVNRLGAHRACLHTEQSCVLIISSGSCQMTEDFNLVVNSQALVLLGKRCQLGNACLRSKNRLAVTDQSRLNKSTFCVHGHQNIDGLATITTYRFKIHRLKHITFELWLCIRNFSAFSEQGVKRHARLHFTHHEGICKNFIDIFFK